MASRFASLLRARNSDPANRRWLYVPYDQLSDRMGPLLREDPRELGIILIENPAKAARRPYHKQKLAMVLANMRHFALEQAARGVCVDYRVVNGPYRNAFLAHPHRLPIRMMEAAERELRCDLAPLIDARTIEVIPHEGWLTSIEDLHASHPRNAPPWRMDVFYRYIRKQTGLLMERGKPAGEKFSHDAENRKRWRGSPPAPERPKFHPDEVTLEVGELIERHFGHHPGELRLDDLPATADDAGAVWEFAKERALPLFGPYEDAMSVRSAGLFHTRISPLLNLHRLLPRDVLADAVELPIPLGSKEGFVRQLLGWREYMHNVHVATDGFRTVEGITIADQPGDGGYSNWSKKPWPVSAPDDRIDGGVIASVLGSSNPLPPAFWGDYSGMYCLDHVVDEVWKSAYSHHITRLMILSNIATLLDVSPRELTDWFWVAYFDAYDWVVEPNVLGMGAYGFGDLFMTKPYVAGSSYIHRMSDYCEHCQFDPETTCPIRRLYWAFLERHADQMRANHRLMPMLRSLPSRNASEKQKDRETFESVLVQLQAGKELEAPNPQEGLLRPSSRRAASKRGMDRSE